MMKFNKLMKVLFFNSNNMMMLLKKTSMDLPSPMNLSLMWNFGSLLSFCFLIQIMSGLILAIHYHNGMEESFNSIIFIQRDVWMGWIFRVFHMNGASLFFIFIYSHMMRGIYYFSFSLKEVWNIGILILILLMAIAFFGYVLPFGQMSYWGATVIINLISVIPYIGSNMVIWVWGGFSVTDATVVRFFIFHFIAPFIMGFFIILHFFFLHKTGSNNMLGLDSSKNKIVFNFFLLKDMIGFFFFFMIFMVFNFSCSFYLCDCENFFFANSMSTPTHIKPEWYFLWAYAILRCVPNKTGGVILLVMSVLVMLMLSSYNIFYFNLAFFFFKFLMFWIFIMVMVYLTWMGGSPAEEPYYSVSQILTFYYFFFFIVYPL